MEKAADSYRYERKFVISELTTDEAEHIVKTHPAIFCEVFHQRFVNNIYFDSVFLDSFHDSIDGHSRRMKSRIRWYGDLFGNVEKPVLEFKMKSGLEGRKLSFALPPFRLGENLSFPEIRNLFMQSEIPFAAKRRLDHLFPTLLNRYSRKYFQSVNRRFRITLDRDLSFYKLSNLDNTFLNRHRDRETLVLELKYDDVFDGVADRIASVFPFRLVRSSKYVAGIERLRV